MKNKTRLNKLKKDFFKAPTKIFRMDLDSSTVLVYCYMASCSEKFNPSIRTISNVLRISNSTASDAINKLKDMNIIQMNQPLKKGFRAEYKFMPPDQWRKLEQVLVAETIPARAPEEDHYGDDDNEF